MCVEFVVCVCNGAFGRNIAGVYDSFSRAIVGLLDRSSTVGEGGVSKLFQSQDEAFG